MSATIRSLRTITLLASLLGAPAFAAPVVVELTADASRTAINDLVHATVAAEASGATTAELSRVINNQIADALKTAKAYPGIKVQSGGVSTYPNFSRSGKIDSWRMRAELSLESGDTAAVSELLGKLQATLGVSSLVMQPSTETRKKTENDAILDALTAFKARAKLIGEAFGKPFSIKQLTVNTSGSVAQPRYRAVAKSMLSESSPMPIEAGESVIVATVSGKVELE